MPSGRLLNWLEARNPDAEQLESIAAHLAEHDGGPQFGILLLDLDNDMDKLQVTLDSLLGWSLQGVQDRGVHHRRIAGGHHGAEHRCTLSMSPPTNYVDKLNQIVAQSTVRLVAAGRGR